jgi:hypothetical protein
MLSRRALAVLSFAVTAQVAIGAAAGPSWGWPASCALIAGTLLVVRRLAVRP